MNFKLILHTLPHLRWEQVFYRVVRVAQFRAYAVLPSLAARWQTVKDRAPEPAAEVTETIRQLFETSFLHHQAPLESYDQMLTGLLENKFTLLNRTLSIPQPDWNRRYQSHLWNYQFHYFGYLVPAARACRYRCDVSGWQRCQELIESWIRKAVIGRSDGWDAYPTSLRVVNWIYAYALLEDRLPQDRVFLRKWRASIYQQLDFLSQHTEKHLLANHLLENAKTLVIGGLFFADDAKGRQWLAQGEKILWRELDEQVLEDGGHYERAPMYHALALGGFLECFALLREFRRQRNLAWQSVSSGRIIRKLRAMTRFLAVMSYADGTLALFNDSANTEQSAPPPLLAAAARIIGDEAEPQSPVFPETGYYCWLSPDETEKIIVDAGPPSVDYCTAHAHCDLLSYELRFDGRPFIVDSGVHGYDGDRFREYCRATRAHNTVMFDGREQSEVWGTFRMARRAELLGVEVSSDERTWDFRGAYQPYSSDVIHERTIRRTQIGEWIIEDRVESGTAKRAESFIHLHPDVRVRQVSERTIECTLGKLSVLIEPIAAASVRIATGEDSPIQGWYFPEFGLARPNPTICLEYVVKAGETFGYRIRRAGSA